MQRSTEEELLDQTDPPEEELNKNLREIITINRLTGAYPLTRAGIRRLIPEGCTEVSIADVGCGGGDALMNLAEKPPVPGIKLKLTGVDLLPGAIEFAKKINPHLQNVNWIVDDFEHYFANLTEKPDIIVAGMFCHHLPDEKLKTFLRLAYENTNFGVVINDLHRAYLPYYFIKIATALLSGSRFTRYDAPLSVKKGFTKKEWQSLISSTGIKDFSVEWCWAFRHLVVINSAGIVWGGRERGGDLESD